MEKIKLAKLSLGSFIKMNFIGGLFFGIFVDLFMWILVLAGLGDSASVSLGTTIVTGASAAIIGIVIAPLVSGLIWVFLSLFTGVGLKIFMFIFRGLTIKGKIKDIGKKENKSEVFEKPIEESTEEVKE